MAEIDYTDKPGFQSTETTSVEVNFYHHDDDPIITTGRKKTELNGKRIDDPNASILSVSTQKTLGTASGNWSVVLKPTYESKKLIYELVDDDWVDIIFKKHNRSFHTMRGLVENIRELETVSGSGATSTVYTISGRCFAKIFEQTPIWFNLFSRQAEDIEGSTSLNIFSGQLFDNAVDITVFNYLLGFLKELEGVGRANWSLPEGMPGKLKGSFADNLYYVSYNYLNDPPRIAIDPNFSMPGGTIWSLAQEYSDPMFCELFCDLWTDRNEYPEQNQELLPEETHMVAVLRDKPFPVVDNSLANNLKDSPWFKLPLYIIPRGIITTSDLGRSGLERKNAFFVAPQVSQELLDANGLDITAPLWDEFDIFTHGLRRLDVTSKYVAQNSDLLTMSKEQRLRIRDWYAINPNLWSGTIDLGVGMPEIRIGSRVKIPGRTIDEQDRIFYVEQVSNNWSYGSGLKTSLGVSRGWIGDENSLLNAMTNLAETYRVSDKSEAGA